MMTDIPVTNNRHVITPALDNQITEPRRIVTVPRVRDQKFAGLLLRLSSRVPLHTPPSLTRACVCVMWLTLAWASPPFSSSTLCLPCDNPANTTLGHACHDKKAYAHVRPACSCRTSSFRMMLSAAAFAPPGKHAHRLGIQAANAGNSASAVAETAAGATTAVAATASSRRLSSSPLTVAILAATLGSANISRQRLRKLADSPAVTSQLESALSGGGMQASRAQAKLRKLLEAVEQVVGEKGDGDGSASAAAIAAKVVTGCPELLLLEGRKLLGAAKQLREMVRYGMICKN